MKRRTRQNRTANPLYEPVVFDPPVRLDNSRVVHENVTQFQIMNWVIRPSGHSIISGPNSTGKSTLAQLMSGDHPLAGLERIAGLDISTMIFVSHRRDEHLEVFQYHLLFKPDGTGALLTVSSL